MNKLIVSIAVLALAAASCSNQSTSNDSPKETDSILLKRSYEAERKTKAPLLAQKLDADSNKSLPYSFNI